jgi:hypothetical protein
MTPGDILMTRKPWRRAALVSALLVLATAAQADTPEESARAYFNALKSTGLGAVADFTHPAELQRFKAMVLPIYQAEAQAGQGELRKLTFGAEATLAQVESAEPAAFMRGFMNIIASRAGAVGLQFESIEVLGSVAEGETVHVLTRMRMAASPMTITKMEVVSLKKQGEDWKLMLSGQFEGMAQALAGRMKPKE